MERCAVFSTRGHLTKGVEVSWNPACVLCYVHFMHHVGWILVPWYLVRHYSGYSWEGVFIDMINIWISGFWVEQLTLYHVAGPHPTSWGLNATKTDHPEKKFCHPTPFELVTTTLPQSPAWQSDISDSGLTRPLQLCEPVPHLNLCVCGGGWGVYKWAHTHL